MLRDSEYRLLFESVPGCNLVLDRDLIIVAASEQYLQATMTRREDILGRGVFEVFPEDPDDRGTSGQVLARASFERVFRERRANVSSLLRYPIRHPTTEGTAFEERFWRTTNSPIQDANGEVAYLLHHAEDVTELVRLEQKRDDQAETLKEVSLRSDHYGQLLDLAPDATVVVDDQGTISMVNRQAEQMFGYGRAELIGQTLEVLLPERLRAGHALHLRRFFASPQWRPMGSGLTLFGRCKDGRELPIEVSLSPQRGKDGLTVMAAIRDISDRQRLEAATRTMAHRLKSAVESIQDAFALFDADDRLVLCNSVYLRLLQDAVPGPLVGKTLGELLEAWSQRIDFPSDGARERFLAARLASRRSESATSFDLHMRDGRRLRVTDRRTADGGLVKTIWDLTEDEERAEELRLARSSAEAASAAKSEFLASMSHELRTPLNAILGFAQLMMRDKRDVLSTRHVERARHILQAGEHLLRLIDDVLDLARIEAGRISIAAEPVDVYEVFEEVHRTLQPLAERHGVRVYLPTADATTPRVFVDRTRYAQILLNFGSNAAKYNRSGGSVTLSVSQSTDDRLRVTVSDTGFGIAPDKQDKLFQPFQRAGQETGPIEGTGIGLMITKRLAEMMGGSVGFHSVLGEGSSFWVDAPLETSNDYQLATPRVATTPTKPDAPRAERRMVLYVEDNPANVTFMGDLMMSSLDSVDLVSVPSAELGIAFARSRRPTLIIMDINLPGMNGVEALEALRGIPETADVPVIALTAAASERDRQRGLDAGFYRYLTKPVKVDELMSAIESLVPL